MKKISVILALFVLISGCVSKKVHLQEVEEKQSIQKQLADTKSELEETEKLFKEYQALKEAEMKKNEIWLRRQKK